MKLRTDFQQKYLTFGSGVVLPFTQALITGGLCGMAVGSVVSLFAPTLAAGSAGMAAGSVAAAAAWMSYRNDWAYEVMYLAGAVDAPQAEGNNVNTNTNANTNVVSVHVTQEDSGGYVKGDFIELPAKPEQLAALAAGLAAGRSLAENLWTGRGKPFSKAEYATLRAELIQRGLAQWRDPETPAQGWELLAAGRSVIREFSGVGEEVAQYVA